MALLTLAALFGLAPRAWARRRSRVLLIAATEWASLDRLRLAGFAAVIRGDARPWLRPAVRAGQRFCGAGRLAAARAAGRLRRGGAVLVVRRAGVAGGGLARRIRGRCLAHRLAVLSPPGWPWSAPGTLAALAALGAWRGVDRRHRRLFHRPRLGPAQARAADQPGQDLGRRLRRPGRHGVYALALARLDARQSTRHGRIRCRR